MSNIALRRREWLRDAAAIATIISMILNVLNYLAGIPFLGVVSVFLLVIVLYYASRPVHLVVSRYQFDWNAIMGQLYMTRAMSTSFSHFPEFNKQLVNYLRTLAYCASIDGRNDLAEEFRKEADKLQSMCVEN